jgi:plastocyanin
LPETLKSRTARKLAVAVFGLALASAACAPAGNPPNLPIASGGNFVISVVDSLYDAGSGASVALDADGSPSVSYLLLSPVLKPSQIPVPIVAGAAQPPSVMVATQSKGIWTQTSVTAQPTVGKKAVGSATEIADADGHGIANVNTAVAVDAQGHHHVVWATPTGLFYSTDASGSYAAAEQLSRAAAFGASIAVGQDGSPWISYYVGGSLNVSHKMDSRWIAESIAVGLAPPVVTGMRTAIAVGSSGPVVAYDDHGATGVSRTTGSGWSTETIPGQGGLGVSMALDSSGDPHLAYYDDQGNVFHAHSLAGAPWEVTPLASVGPGPNGQPDPGWGTGIGLDGNGVHYVTWADTKAKDIAFATNGGGSFQAEAVDDSATGLEPSIAVSADGKSVALAWYDSSNSNLNVAQSSAEGLAIAHPTTRPGLPSGVPTGGATCSPGGTSLQIVAPVGAQASGFDVNCLAVKAGAAFTVDFTNNDGVVPHNFEIFTDSSATTRLGGAGSPGEIVAGGSSTKYNVDPLQAGTYFFHCDIHPTTMTGTFIVTK